MLKNNFMYFFSPYSMVAVFLCNKLNHPFCDDKNFLSTFRFVVSVLQDTKFLHTVGNTVLVIFSNILDSLEKDNSKFTQIFNFFKVEITLYLITLCTPFLFLIKKKNLKQSLIQYTLPVKTSIVITAIAFLRVNQRFCEEV